MAFNEAKTTEAAAYLLQRLGGRAEYHKLLTLLYLADREAIRSGGRAITGDAYYSMDQGPVLCRTLDLMEGGAGLWGRTILKEGYEAVLDHDPGTDELSRSEIKTLDAVADEHAQTDWRELVKLTHALPEWRYPAGGRVPIALREIAEAVGHSRETALSLVEEVEHEDWFKRVVGML